MDNFYVFEVLEDFKDVFTIKEKSCNKFSKGERFIGYELKLRGKYAVKSNFDEVIMISLDKVKKIYKIEFEEIKGE